MGPCRKRKRRVVVVVEGRTRMSCDPCFSSQRGEVKQTKEPVSMHVKDAYMHTHNNKKNCSEINLSGRGYG